MSCTLHAPCLLETLLANMHANLVSPHVLLVPGIFTQGERERGEGRRGEERGKGRERNGGKMPYLEQNMWDSQDSSKMHVSTTKVTE